eukprot:7959886-Alexandrium_andersonii.AAC.1
MGSKSTARGSGVGRSRGRRTSAARGGGGAPSIVRNNSHSASPQSSAASCSMAEALRAASGAHFATPPR